MQFIECKYFLTDFFFYQVPIYLFENNGNVYQRGKESYSTVYCEDIQPTSNSLFFFLIRIVLGNLDLKFHNFVRTLESIYQASSLQKAIEISNQLFYHNILIGKFNILIIEPWYSQIWISLPLYKCFFDDFQWFFAIFSLELFYFI